MLGLKLTVPPHVAARALLQLLCGMSVFALGGVAHAATAGARVIEEVVVTARRMEENTQQVPLTVTAVSPDDMKQQNIIRATDLTYAAPSLTIAPSFNTLNNAYSVRGLAAGVATYFAESACCTGNASVPFLDLQSVQVLNGPQGTLFGRSSGSGSILIEPRRPDLDEWGGSVSTRLGDYNRKEITGTLNAPLIEDALAMRLAVNAINVEGFTDQIGSKNKLDEQKSQQVRLGFQYDNERFTNYLVGNYIHLDQTASNEVLSAINTNIGLYNLPAAAGPAVLGNACAGAVSIGLSPDVATCVTQRMNMLSDMKSALIAEMHRVNQGDSAVRLTPAAVNDNPAFLKLRNWSVLNSAEFGEIELGPLKVSVTDILSYESIVNNTGNPADGIGGAAEQAGAFNTAGIGANNTRNGKVVARLGPPTTTLNNDLKVFIDAWDGILSTTVGYFHSRYDQPSTKKGTGNIYQIFGGVLNADLGYNSALGFSDGGHGGQRAWYTQSTLDATELGIPGLNLTVGYRKSWDDTHFTSRNAVFTLATGSYSPGATKTIAETESDGYNYLVAVSEEFTDNFMVYASVSRAYIPGGINVLVQNATNLPNYKPVYDPQVVVTRELGAKLDFTIGDIPARLNAAIYRYDFTDIAVGFSGFTGTTSIAYTANVAAADLQGLELAGAIKPTDDWEFSFAYNYNDAEYSKWTASDPHNAARPGDAICSPTSQPQTCLIDLTNNPFVRMPEHQGHATVAYYAPVPESLGELTLSASVYAQSLVWFNSSAKRLLQVLPTAKDGISQKAYSVLNLRADWRDIANSGFDGAIFVNNATDETYALGMTPQLLTLGFSIATYAPPRMVGLEIAKHF